MTTFHHLHTIAERAREHHLRACGLTPSPWHLMTPQAQRAWASTVELVACEVRRMDQAQRAEELKERQCSD